MKDLFDTIAINERKRQRIKSVRRPGEELLLESDSLYESTGGEYSDRSFFDLDHAIASSGRSRARSEAFDGLAELDVLETDLIEEY